MKRIRFGLGILLLALQIACSPQLVAPGPLPSPEIAQVAVTPALIWLEPIFQRCAAAQAGVHLVLSEMPANQFDPGRFDIHFRWGGVPQSPFSAVIGQDELALVVNPRNPLELLALDQAVGLFNGKFERWSQVRIGDFDGVVTAYRYASSDDVQDAADWLQVGPSTVFSPEPSAVRQAVASETYSIGYLPARWVDGTVKRVKVADLKPGQAQLPVLAMAQAEPQGSWRAWLLCVQEQVK